MKTVYIMGFGCGGKNDITLRTVDILRQSDRVFVRTMEHPSASILDEYGIEYTSFDDIYESMDSFADVYGTIAETVLAAEGDIISYIVPGSCFIAERAVGLIVSGADRSVCDVRIIPAVSFIDGIFSSLKTDAADSFKMLDALSLDTQKPDTSCMNIICQVYDRDIAGDVKLALSEYYPDETDVYMVTAASTDEEDVRLMKLYEIDRSDNINHLTSLVIPPQEYTSVPRMFSSLLSTVEKLRSDDGCPWDREQTHESLKPYIVEEAYEVVSAIEEDDPDNLCEELGDLLLEIVLHARISEEWGDFNMGDVIEGICTKMINRHPHVFGDEILTGDQNDRWDEIKKEEHSYTSASEELSDVAKALPSLTYAQKLIHKGEKYQGGKRSVDLSGETLISLASSLGSLEGDEAFDAAGRLLFMISGILGEKGINGEEALRQYSREYVSYMNRIDNIISMDSISAAEMSPEEYEKVCRKAEKMHKFVKND